MHRLFQQNWHYVPIETTPHPYMSFAMDDVLQEIVSTDGVPKFRAWVHHPYVILGLHDARLPHLTDGLSYLEEAGFDYIVRNSGGLGVVLDTGVLNVSLILPKSSAAQIDEGYDMMLELVREAFPDTEIEAYEIEHSYCPGSYDLSIDGRKFAGISQRRIKQGVAVQIYLCITGSGAERAEIMRNFYEAAKKGKDTKFSYPDIHPGDMASLNELLGTELTVDGVLERMLDIIRKDGRLEPLPDMDAAMRDRYHHYIDRMKQRNKDIRSEKEDMK
ncbi:lipoate--protein ligase family protein [Salinicoccus roseus]|uniref:Octanoyl-[GcvH]:protein N-octanoyltransferase n=1 Tax=Salinicoccus roseus TaxID=45670 RepID=A0A0C2DK34_9STAP|nr:lipoate--protein ligase family protein [Salinicoccus roseus]KIH70343.1 lipoate--protein ligase [Salinicoccus roseus]MDB0580885.1 lipoate--protein ligase family protein [Salinicoccus roseus]